MVTADEPLCGEELCPGVTCALPASVPHIEHATGDGGCTWKSMRTTVEAARAVMGKPSQPPGA